jgi:hypothetical protein
MVLFPKRIIEEISQETQKLVARKSFINWVDLVKMEGSSSVLHPNNKIIGNHDNKDQSIKCYLCMLALD